MDFLRYDSDAEKRSLSVFIDAIGEQKEAALCIADNARSISFATHTLRSSGYTLRWHWREALRTLECGCSVALVATLISKEIYELFSQYNSRAGMVQIFDKDDFSFLTRHLQIAESRFVVVTTNSAIIDASGPILSHAGLIFRGELV
jgi:hypothetical protein